MGQWDKETDNSFIPFLFVNKGFCMFIFHGVPLRICTRFEGSGVEFWGLCMPFFQFKGSGLKWSDVQTFFFKC